MLWVCIYSLRYIERSAHAPYCPMACPALQYFSTLSHKRHYFRKKSYWTQNVCFDFFYKFCLKHFLFQEELSEIWSKMYIGLHVKYRCYCCQTWMKHKFPNRFFREIFKCQISWDSVQWQPSCSIRTDGHEEVIVAFRNLENAPSKGGYTLATLPRIVTPYRDSVDGTRDRATRQKLVTR